jgi:hypothetical protein
MTVVVETFAITFLKSTKLFGARYNIIVRFEVGHMAPIVSTSMVFSMVAPSVGFGWFVAPFTGTIMTLGKLAAEIPR